MSTKLDGWALELLRICDRIDKADRFTAADMNELRRLAIDGVTVGPNAPQESRRALVETILASLVPTWCDGCGQTRPTWAFPRAAFMEPAFICDLCADSKDRAKGVALGSASDSSAFRKPGAAQ